MEKESLPTVFSDGGIFNIVVFTSQFQQRLNFSELNGYYSIDIIKSIFFSNIINDQKFNED
ncbi:hypothetical protein C5471_04160 [Photorhabdus tasmaniensis]|uniref:Uncharacterized protein n=1 Tax=Photorhabdus tasmaniensis TaxID=1004159 RepID=A0ABX0GG97_9GAMM|nr:hypothetical protein [Photorhabdus tasmaniensis]